MSMAAEGAQNGLFRAPLDLRIPALPKVNPAL
jgi:hypothetical protein